MKLSGPDAPDHEQRRAKGKRLGRPRVIVDAARIGRLHEARRKFLEAPRYGCFRIRGWFPSRRRRSRLRSSLQGAAMHRSRHPVRAVSV